MCGIAGYFGTAPGSGRLEAACRLLAHRGPDGQRWVEGEGYGLGHALLSILGLRPVPQPVRAGTGTLTFNGEIYNYLELVEENPVLGSRFEARSDTEILAEGLALQGAGFLPFLNGIFAIAWMDHRTGTGLLARDPLGVKPLYYTTVGGTLLFASETRALRHLADLPATPDAEGLYSYVRFRYPLGERSLYRGIRMLPPGCALVWEQGRVQIQPFAVPDPIGQPSRDVEEAIALSADLLTRAVRWQTRSDRDFCTFLSGGLDSSLLSAMATRQVRSLDTYSVGFPDPAEDESAPALEVARHIGSCHRGPRIDQSAYQEAHIRMVQRIQEPIGVPNQVALSWLCAGLAQKHRCVLSGEGADEVFGGYGRIFLLGLDWERLEGRMATPGGLDRLLLRWPARPAAFADFFHDRYAYVSAEEARVLLRPFLEDDALARAESALREDIRTAFGALGPLPGDLMRLFQRLHLPGLLLRVDTATMANGVEGRVPFLDTRLVSHLNAQPWTWKMRPGPGFFTNLEQGVPAEYLSEEHVETKAILKQIAEPWLPAPIIRRPKLGFPVPVDFYRPSGLPAGVSSAYGAWIHANLRLWAAPEANPWKS